MLASKKWPGWVRPDQKAGHVLDLMGSASELGSARSSQVPPPACSRLRRSRWKGCQGRWV